MDLNTQVAIEFVFGLMFVFLLNGVTADQILGFFYSGNYGVEIVKQQDKSHFEYDRTHISSRVISKWMFSVIVTFWYGIYTSRYTNKCKSISYTINFNDTRSMVGRNSDIQQQKQLVIMLVSVKVTMVLKL